MHPALPPDPSLLAVDRVEWVPSSAHGLHVHLIGRWGERAIEGSPRLLVGSGESRPSFAALAEPPAGVLLAFEVPNELRPALGSIALQLGTGAIALPAAEAGWIDASPGEVIDHAVLAERRARRAEQSDEATTRRAEAAERTVATLTAQLTNLEQRVGLLNDERAALEAQLGDADRRLDQSLDSARTELKRLEHELAARRDVHGAILAQLAAANAELQQLRGGQGSAPLPPAHTSLPAPERPEASPASGSAQAIDDLEQRIAALEQRREGAPAEGLLLRDVFDARSHELERARIELRQQLLDVIGGLRDAASGDRASRLELERELIARERREAELQRLVAEVLRTSASLRTRFEAEIRELEKRMTDRLVSERAAAAEELEAAQRKIAELEARVHADDQRRERGGSGHDLTLRLRAEAESLRSELSRVRALAEAQAQGGKPAEAMIGGLDAAASRLREQAAPLEDDLPAEPSLVPAGAATAAAPAPTAAQEQAAAVEPAEAAPLEPRRIESSRVPASWLGPAIAQMAVRDSYAAERLVLALLPALRPERLELSFELTLDELGRHRVVVGRQATTVEPLDAPGPRGSVDFRLHGPPQAFAELAGGGMRRRPKELRVSGRKWRLRRLVKQLRRPVGLADLQAAGATLDPGLLLTALAAGVEPHWTVGHRFAVAWKVSGEHAGTWHADVRPGRPPVIAAGMPPDPPAATVYVTEGGLIPLLGNLELPAGDAASVVGDAAAVALLRQWFDRAQGLV